MNWQKPFTSQLHLFDTISNKEQKEKIAHQVATYLKPNDVVGVGSGSSSYLALLALVKKSKEEHIPFTAIPTSHELLLTCQLLGISTTTLSHQKPDWGFDGADEVDGKNRLIKGRGGALFKEKLVMKASKKTFILIDQSKHVEVLGQKTAVPIEVFPDALSLVEHELLSYGVSSLSLRLAKGKDGPVITENGNFILDVFFHSIDDGLEKEIKRIPGVIESGLFFHYPIELIENI